MPHSSASRSFLGLVRSFSKLDLSDPLTQCLAPRFSRSLASQTSLPIAELPGDIASAKAVENAKNVASQPSQVLTTVYQWPHMQPTRWAWYNEKLLNMPLRKDILHRAVIFEADGSRQGSASSKHRTAVHGSNRKIQAQKGLGRARAGDKKSPIRKGGGKAHGPHPRDFSTKLQRKVYDIAWRTALSHRYRKGELIVLDNRMGLPQRATPRFLDNFFEAHRWGQGNGRSMMVTGRLRSKGKRVQAMKSAMAQVGEHGTFKDIWDVDVKDLLETGRVIIEKHALDTLLFAHASDLGVVANLKYAVHAKKQDFLQYAHPMSDAQLMQADEAMLEEVFDEFEEEEEEEEEEEDEEEEEEEEAEMEDGLELEDLQVEESRVEIR